MQKKLEGRTKSKPSLPAPFIFYYRLKLKTLSTESTDRNNNLQYSMQIIFCPSIGHDFYMTPSTWIDFLLYA